MSAADPAPRLETVALDKSFGGQHALREVGIAVHDGEVVGLIGENGAGKSTLLNVLSGVLAADAGELRLDGVTVRPRDYRAANRLGIFRVFQEPALVDSLRVYESMFFGWESLFRTRLGTLDRTALRRAAEAALEREGVGRIAVGERVGRLSQATRQSVDIARVTALAEQLGIERPIVLFDEPTSALDSAHEENFLRLLEDLRGRATVLFVSHRLPEILRTCARVIVLKDGRKVAERSTENVAEDELHRLMVGRVRTANYYRQGAQLELPEAGAAAARLRIDSLTVPGALADVSLGVAAGEILGIAGTDGSGKRELGAAIAGALPVARSSILLDGRPLPGGVPAAVGAGIAYIPAERARDGLIVKDSIARNIQLPSLRDRFATRIGGVWRRRAGRAAATASVKQLGIVARGIDAPIMTLSGGNQQKVLLAKWMLRSPRVIVLDGPTQGVDSGAREGIYDLIRDAAARGSAIVLISDDLPELIGLSNRVAVVTHGSVSEIVPAPADAKPDEHALVALMVSGGETRVRARRSRDATRIADAVRTPPDGAARGKLPLDHARDVLPSSRWPRSSPTSACTPTRSGRSAT